MVFSNVAFDYSNFSTGPIAGRIYSIDHVNGTLVAKTFPSQTNIITYPLDVPISGEVKTLYYDGYYFWTMVWIGNNASNGLYIEKWYLLNDVVLKKQFGVGCQFFLLNSPSRTFDSSAFTVRVLKTTLTASAGTGATYVDVASTQYFAIGDTIYLGPSTMTPGIREERKISGLSGNRVLLDLPLTYPYNITNQLICRKEIYLFNNKIGIEDYNGTLYTININSGAISPATVGLLWKGVEAATCLDGKIVFVKDMQLLQYNPYGINYGIVSSQALRNTKSDKDTIIHIYGIAIEGLSIYKLQKERVYYDTLNYVWQDETSLNNKYNIDTDYITPYVFSMTCLRDRSTQFGVYDERPYTIEMRDQFQLPVFNRSVTIQEDDSSGYIKSGYSSFVTNSQGQGLTYYNTGGGPANRIVSLSATDLAGNYKVSYPISQISYINGNNKLSQLGKIRGLAYLNQNKNSSYKSVVQDRISRSLAMVEQRAKTPGITTLVQTVNRFFKFIEQKKKQISTFSLDQKNKISVYTNINQYVFLIYALPVPYSVKNDPYTNILVRIAGFGSINLDVSTLIFRINGIDVTSQIVVTPFSGGLQLELNPVDHFDYGSRVDVFISIQDISLPPRRVETHYYFDVSEDYKRPSLYEVFPPDQSLNNDSKTEIYCIVKDLETGIDTSSIKLYIDGKTVDHTISILDNSSVKVFYQPLSPLTYGVPHFASVYMEDNRGNYNIGGWSFTIEESSGIFIYRTNPQECSELIPIDSSVCAEVFGNNDGINIKTLTFTINGKEVEYVLQPKVLKVEE